MLDPAGSGERRGWINPRFSGYHGHPVSTSSEESEYERADLGTLAELLTREGENRRGNTGGRFNT